jgi:hypothetical protein
MGYRRPINGRNRFAFYGVADGEYELIAHHIVGDNEESFASAPRRLPAPPPPPAPTRPRASRSNPERD